MQVIKSNGNIDEDGFLHVGLSTQLPPGTVEFVIVIHPGPKDSQPYDFSDIAGKLKWQGDAVEAQRRLRDEW